MSLRDRDDEPAETVKADLVDPSAGGDAGYFPRRWRRRYIESYLIWRAAIAAAAGVPETEVVKELRDRHGIAVGPNFTDSDPPQALLDVRGEDRQLLLGSGRRNARGVAIRGRLVLRLPHGADDCRGAPGHLA